MATTTIEASCVAVLGAGVSQVKPPQASDPARSDRLYQAAEKFLGLAQYSTARALFEEARASLTNPHPVYAYRIACCDARMGERDSAARWLQIAINEGWRVSGEDPELAALRDHPLLSSLAKDDGRYIFYDHPGEIPIFSSALVIIGAWINGAPWEGWLLL